MRRTISHGNGATIHSLSKAEPAKTWNGAPVRGIDTHSFGLLRSNCISRTYVSTQSYTQLLYTSTIHPYLYVRIYTYIQRSAGHSKNQNMGQFITASWTTQSMPSYSAAEAT